MYQQLNENADLDKVINMVDKFREELVAMKKEATATTVEEIIEHEGLKLRKVNREAKEGDYIRLIAPSTSGYIVKDKIYGPVKNKTVKVGVFSWDVYNWNVNRTPSTVEVFEVVKEIKPEDLPFPEVELTANQRRAALIEKAKAFVEEQKTTIAGIAVYGPNKNQKVEFKDVFVPRNNRTNFRHSACKAEFIVKKNKLTCLLKGVETSNVYGVGRSKCAPGDVFNEHIGRAIALARALEIDVPEEFLKAVQPNEIVMGMDLEIRSNGKLEFDHKPINVIDLEDCNKDFQADEYGTFIIDDTNAKYDEVN